MLYNVCCSRMESGKKAWNLTVDGKPQAQIYHDWLAWERKKKDAFSKHG